MNADIEQECRLLIRQHFEHLSDRVQAELRNVINADYSPAAHCLWFEYDSPHFDDSFPVMFCVLDRAGEALIRREFLPEISSTIPESLLNDPRYESEDNNTWNLASEVLQLWFADLWEAAGGHNSRLPGYLAHHDSMYSFDLTHRKELREPMPEFPDKLRTR
jgi:hypothetical protein